MEGMAMSPFALLSLFRGRGSLYGLLGVLVLSTLWVTSLTLLSAPQNATELLTDAGSHVLNPFLTKQGLGLTQQIYDSRKAHLNQQLALTPLNVHMTGKDIDKPTYGEAVQGVYKSIADAYYISGRVDTVFAVPSDLQQLLPYLTGFGFFGSAGSPSGTPGASGTPGTAGLPDFLQPIFTVIGLTPVTFTAQGNKNLLNLLPWFWLAVVVLGVIAVVLNRGSNKLSGLAQTVVHSAWPIALLLIGLTVAARVSSAVAPYASALGVIDRAFLPAYGGALLVGGAALIIPKLLGGRRQAQPQQPVMAGVPAGSSLGSLGSIGSMSSLGSLGSIASMGSRAATPPTPPTSYMAEPQPSEPFSPFDSPSDSPSAQSDEPPQSSGQWPDAT
jgi:hypothetical protein